MAKNSVKLLLVLVVTLVVAGSVYGGWPIWESIKETGQKSDHGNKSGPLVKRPSDKDVQSRDLDISDWKTYRSEKYEFEFRYPGDWVEDGQYKDLKWNYPPYPAKEFIGQNMLAYFADFQAPCGLDACYDFLMLGVVENVDGLSMSRFFEARGVDVKEDLVQVKCERYVYKETKIAGIKGYTFSTLCLNNQRTFIPHGKYIIVLDFFNSTRVKGVKTFFDKILASFKFMK